MNARYNKIIILLILLFPAILVFNGGYFQWVAGYLYLFIIQGYVAWLLFFRTGQSFYGYSATMALGAYSCVVLTRLFQLSLPAVILLGAGLSALLGVIFFLCVSRARGFYAGMASFLLALLFPKLIEALYSLTGGRSGVDFPGLIPVIGFDSLFLIVVFVTVAVVALFFWLINTRTGKILTLIRENDELAQAVGINTLKYKALAYAISGAVSGLGGALYLNYVGSISSVDINVFTTISIFFIPLLGGGRSTIGPLVGAIFIILLPELLAPVERYIEILFGLAYILVMLFLPEGLVPNIRRLAGMVRAKISQ